MTQEQAQNLAKIVLLKFPHVQVSVVQSGDSRQVPYDWFVAVERPGASAEGLHLHDIGEWNQALIALHVLSK